jgi:high-affinity nickel-transport protein
MNRFLGRATRSVTKPWQMYPLGILFGLGFDTATEVALLFLAAGAAGAGLPWYAILVLPVLFAAGMSLLDTIDGSFMNFAYEWAFSKPVRKVYYNITITGLSVVVAFIIGSIEIFGIVAEKAHLTGGFWDWVSGLDLNKVGYGIVVLFVLTWAVALAVWKYGRIEQKWAAGMRETEVTSADAPAAT